jgi:hypothetical protein
MDLILILTKIEEMAILNNKLLTSPQSLIGRAAEEVNFFRVNFKNSKSILSLTLNPIGLTVTTTFTTNGRNSSDSQPSTFRRTVYRRQNTTTIPRTSTPRNYTYDGQTRQTSYRRRYESLYNNSDDTQTQSPARNSISSSIDALLNNQSSTEYRGGSYTYNTRRYNTSSAHGTSQTSTINGQSVQNPILWYNRTWHWSTNRTREYDPDLDGTTLPPRLETGAEEEWDGTDIIRPSFDDRHPFGRQMSPRSQDSFLYYSNIRIDII